MYIRRPVIESSISRIAKRTSFPSDHSADSLDQLIVKRGSVVNGGGEASSVAEVVWLRSELHSWCRTNTMSSLAPPFVCRQTNPTRASRSVDKVQDLLFRGQFIDQRSNPLGDAQTCIADIMRAQRTRPTSRCEQIGPDSSIAFGVINLQESHATHKTVSSFQIIIAIITLQLTHIQTHTCSPAP